MKALRIIAICAAVYVGIVVVFESLLGVIQPEPDGAIVITTFDEGGDGHSRVVTGLEVEGALYVAANHWPRGWYRSALERPEIEVEVGGQRTPVRAVELEPDEVARVEAAHPLPIVFRALTGFPPRELLRLDPR